MIFLSLRRREGRMVSVYERVLGSRIDRLDPALRAYFGVIPPGAVGRGSGVYEVAGSRHRWLRPVFAWLATREILFPEFGHDIPFAVENRGDRTARRIFAFPGRTRVMSDAMQAVDGTLRDRLGRRGGLEVELLLEVPDGGLRMTSRRQWLHLGPWCVRMPGLVRVSLAETARGGSQHVDVRLTAPMLGEVFRYAGTFRYALQPD